MPWRRTGLRRFERGGEGLAHERVVAVYSTGVHACLDECVEERPERDGGGDRRPMAATPVSGKSLLAVIAAIIRRSRETGCSPLSHQVLVGSRYDISA
jgi:hypothetical protein